MTITELAILVLNPGVTLPSKDLSPHFALLSSRQSAWSGHPLRFYALDNKIILLSGWKDVAAHHAWIASDGNQELLKLLTPHLNIEMLVHLDVPFERVPDWESIMLKEVDGADVVRGSAGVVAGDVEGKDARHWHIAEAEGGRDEVSAWKTICV